MFSIGYKTKSPKPTKQKPEHGHVLDEWIQKPISRLTNQDYFVFLDKKS